VIELNGITVVIGLLLIIIGPASGIWSGLKINAVTQRLDSMSERWDDDHKDIRSWLRSLQGKVEENVGEVSAIKAVMEDRKDRK